MEHYTRNRIGPAPVATNRMLLLTRLLEAPPSPVFQVWTEPEHLVNWWGPKGFTIPSCSLDLRPGGGWRACLRSPGGREFWHGGTYRNVQPGRLVFTHAWDDVDGLPGHVTLVTVSFAEHRGKTKLTLHQAVFETVAERESEQEGWAECMARLADYLARLPWR